ncbi:MAG: CPBP family intramembrane metalloprotease, partial [Dehalococcoidia bacterium]|nr:CPBP family intramembrane metalloprotease [Dehalococcoidia bacterium]
AGADGYKCQALISGVVFSGVHLDPGSLIPFFIIGVVLAWLFWRRGNLWESVAFHVIFNAVSFSLLLATEA